jgi:O-antigen/teichoic acid export membrane protein
MVIAASLLAVGLSFAITQETNARNVVALLALSIVLTGATSLHATFESIDNRFTNTLRESVLNQSVRLAAVLGAPQAVSKETAIALGTALGSIAAVPGRKIESIIGKSGAEARHYKRIVQTGVNYFLASLNNRADLIAVTIMAGTSTAGAYSLATSVAGLTAIAGQVQGRILAPQIARELYANQAERCVKLIKKGQRITMSALLPVGLIVVAFGTAVMTRGIAFQKQKYLLTLAVWAAVYLSVFQYEGYLLSLSRYVEKERKALATYGVVLAVGSVIGSKLAGASGAAIAAIIAAMAMTKIRRKTIDSTHKTKLTSESLLTSSKGVLLWVLYAGLSLTVEWLTESSFLAGISFALASAALLIAICNKYILEQGDKSTIQTAVTKTRTGKR